MYSTRGTESLKQLRKSLWDIGFFLFSVTLEKEIQKLFDNFTFQVNNKALGLG
jgi:hypothetical protein